MKSYTFIVVCFLLINNSFSQNLVPNGDFETGGQLNCSGWYDGCGRELIYLCDAIEPDTLCDVMFYQDAPPLDGNWSVGVTGVGNSFPSSANTFITGESGTHIYQLNVWM